MFANTDSSPARQMPHSTCAGFGLGLRTPHYGDFLAAKQNLDWLEIITDNFLVEGGKPLQMLERIRQDYPMAMHGVAMSIGAAQGVDLAYLKKVKALADRIDPLWVSDHLCWIGPGPEQLHDLYPLPYTDEAARHVITQIQRAQDVLQRKLVLENVSSYIDFAGNAASEWQFLSHIANTADCLLLVDVNNIYVSSVNHGFDPLDYLNALPADRVQQIHLAGHSDHGSYIVDTHDHPVAAPVWRLYAQACQRFGAVATMIERDDDIPPLVELIEELGVARVIARDNVPNVSGHAVAALDAAHAAPDTPTMRWSVAPEPSAPSAVELAQLQQRLSRYVLDQTEPAHNAIALVQTKPPASSEQRLGIYHHAYRARLAEVLSDSFAKTNLYMGSDAFTELATAFAVQHPPLTRSLGRYGAELPAYVAALYPNNPELRELAQLDWDLRSRFDGADAPALDAATAASADWLSWKHPLHPSLVLRPAISNVAQLWRAIDADEDVPQAHYADETKTLAVWRKGLQPHFQTLEADEATFLTYLAAGQSIEDAAQTMTGSGSLADPHTLGRWLQEWLENGLLLSK
jgi:uncharacterized protein (UPF0276 family)